MTTVEEFLEHHGVKGQKWGVRKDRGHEGQRTKTKKIAKLDTEFEKSIGRANNGRMSPALHNAIVVRLNSRVQALNDSPKYRNADLSKGGKIKSDYDKDGQEIVLRSFEDAVREQYGVNASGSKKAVYNRKTDTIDIVDIKSMAVSHADVSETPDFSVQLIRDDNGHISSVVITPMDPPLEQTEDFVSNFLEHHGVKGMKWGVTKSGGASAGTAKNSKRARPATDVVAKQKPGTFVKTSGGKRQIASIDAVTVAGNRQIAKKSTTDALSTKQLQEAVTRMNLEQQYSKLAKQSDRRNRGQRFAQKFTKNPQAKEAGKGAAKAVGSALAKAAVA